MEMQAVIHGQAPVQFVHGRKYRRWVFTENFESDQWATERLKYDDFFLEEGMRMTDSSERIRYVIVGYETGEEKEHQHFQGYLELQHNRTHRSLLSLLRGYDISPWLAPSMAPNPVSAIDYCKKDDLWKDWGEPLYLSSEQGKRSDLDRMYDSIWVEKKTRLEIMMDRTTFGVSIKFPKALREHITERDKIANFERLLEMKLKPLPWQQEFLKSYKTFRSRKINYIVGRTGNEGKTELFKMIMAQEGPDRCLYISNAKTNDILHAWGPHPVVLVNLTRQVTGRVNYEPLEAMCDGMAFSPKYDSGMKILPGGSIVICCSNELPDFGRMSRDRWNIIDLDLDDFWCDLVAKETDERKEQKESSERPRLTRQNAVVIPQTDSFVFEEDVPMQSARSPVITRSMTRLMNSRMDVDVNTDERPDFHQWDGSHHGCTPPLERPTLEDYEDM